MGAKFLVSNLTEKVGHALADCLTKRTKFNLPWRLLALGGCRCARSHLSITSSRSVSSQGIRPVLRARTPRRVKPDMPIRNEKANKALELIAI